MKNLVKNSLLFLLVIATSGALSGCIAATVGSALVTLIPGSYDYVDKNSPSSTQSVTLSDMEDVTIVTLKELDFAIEDVREAVVQSKEKIFVKSIFAYPAKAKKQGLKVEVQLLKITKKVTKIVVTAKDSSLSYDGATAQAIMDEILVNVEMERSYVDLDKFLVKADKKRELKKSIKTEKDVFKNGEGEVEDQAAANETLDMVTSSVQEIIEPNTIDGTKVKKPVLKKKINEIITKETVKEPFVKHFKGLGVAPYTVKIGTFSNLKNVNLLLNQWRRKGQSPFYSSVLVQDKTLHRVFLNRFPDKSTAREFIRTLREGKLLHGEAAQPFKASYAIKAGECTDDEACEIKVTKLIAFGVSPYLHPVTLEGKHKYLILVGGYTKPSGAVSSLKSFEDLGLEHSLIKP